MVNYFAVMSVHLLCIVVHVGGRIAGFATFASIPKEVVPPWATFGVASYGALGNAGIGRALWIQWYKRTDPTESILHYKQRTLLFISILLNIVLGGADAGVGGWDATNIGKEHSFVGIIVVMIIAAVSALGTAIADIIVLRNHQEDSSNERSSVVSMEHD